MGRGRCGLFVVYYVVSVAICSSKLLGVLFCNIPSSVVFSCSILLFWGLLLLYSFCMMGSHVGFDIVLCNILDDLDTFSTIHFRSLVAMGPWCRNAVFCNLSFL